MIIASIQNFARVESLILSHLLLHKVFHDARVEALTGLFVRYVVLLWVIEKCLTILILVHRTLLVNEITSASTTRRT